MNGRPMQKEMLCAAFGKDVVNRPGGLEGSVEGAQHARPHMSCFVVFGWECVWKIAGEDRRTQCQELGKP